MADPDELLSDWLSGVAGAYPSRGDDYDDALAAARARIAASEANQRGGLTARLEHLRRRPPQADPRTAIGLSRVGPGWPIYSRERFWSGDEIGLTDPVGGLLIDTHADRYTDDDTGEIVDNVRYRTLNIYRPARPWNTLDAAEIDIDALAGLDRLAVAKAARWCCTQAAKGSGYLSHDGSEWIHTAHILARALT